MRILHTSDWHLGIATGPVSRLEDQRRFLAWLTERLRDDSIDVLIVAGDVFDGAAPSAEAQAVYYRFLAGLPSTGVRDVVVVAGNHDSPSRLDAPRDVLAALDVHVVGAIPPQSEPPDSLLVPLRRRGSDEVRAVCLAVPFVHEHRLGVRTTDLDAAAVAEAFRERFASLYSKLVDAALVRFPGRPVIATGHLAVGEVSRGDYQDEIHQVGYIGALPASVLDERLAYTALGHIHHARLVAGRPAWYCGTPLALSATESAHGRRVLRVDLSDGGQAAVERVDVPVIREVHALEGSPAELEAALRAMTSAAPLPPLALVRARLDAPDPGLRDRLQAAVTTHPEDRRPVLVEVREVFGGPATGQPEAPARSLEELTPAEVFGRLCHARGVVDAGAVERAFATLASASDEDFAAMVERARDPEGGRP